MSRRSVTRKVTTTTTSKTGSKKMSDADESLNINYELLRDEDFDKRPKTDYTYARSATYSPKYDEKPVISPNLSRRKLHRDEVIRDTSSASGLRKMTAANEQFSSTSLSNKYRVYGTYDSQTSLNANNAINEAIRDEAMRTRAKTYYSDSASTQNSGLNMNNANNAGQSFSTVTVTTRTTNISDGSSVAGSGSNITKASSGSESQSAINRNANARSSEQFSEEETEITELRMPGRGKSRGKSRKSASPARQTRSGGSLTRSAQFSTTSHMADMEMNQRDVVDSPVQYNLHEGLDDEVSDTPSSALSSITRKNTENNETVSDTPSSALSSVTRKHTEFNATDTPSSALSSITRKNTEFNATELVTECSTTRITTVTQGTTMSARLAGCALLVYGFLYVLTNRAWWAFGRPVYATVQRYLLVDSWILSRGCIRKLKALLALLLLLLLPIVLLMLAACSLHAAGFLNIGVCSRYTGVYYVTKQADLNEANMSSRLQNLLHSVFTWSSSKPTGSAVPKRHETQYEGTAVQMRDWETIIDGKISNLRSSLELEHNRQLSLLKQRHSELENNLLVVSTEIETLKDQMNGLHTSVSRLDDINKRLTILTTGYENMPDHTATILQIQKEIRALKLKLGEVDISEVESMESGILPYFYSEIIRFLDIGAYVFAVTNKPPEIKQSIPEPVTLPPQACPHSTCVCETELGVRLTKLHEQVMADVNLLRQTQSTVFINSYGDDGNTTGLSEKMVRLMIEEELDTFAEDRTGMVDFALQSMGAQVVSTRCSQTFSEESSLLTFLGVPLYHLHNDPSIVIQPSMNPGECWCFHGSSGSLVVELADEVLFNSFSIEHISPKQTATGDIKSAPKDFEVYGLSSEMDYQGTKIGKWQYKKDERRLQFFPVQGTNIPPFAFVELRVLSNWGKPEFTCLYRFRVHGKLASKSNS